VIPPHVSIQVTQGIVPTFNETLDFALPGMLPPAVKRLPAKTAVRPAVAAGSPWVAHRKQQAIPEKNSEVS